MVTSLLTDLRNLLLAGLIKYIDEKVAVTLLIFKESEIHYGAQGDILAGTQEWAGMSRPVMFLGLPEIV